MRFSKVVTEVTGVTAAAAPMQTLILPGRFPVRGQALVERDVFVAALPQDVRGALESSGATKNLAPIYLVKGGADHEVKNAVRFGLAGEQGIFGQYSIGANFTDEANLSTDSPNLSRTVARKHCGCSCKCRWGCMGVVFLPPLMAM